MRGDLSRTTRHHAEARGYDRVEMQQGRVLLDADWNEQGAIDADRARRTGHDVVGGCGVPRRDPGFLLRRTANDLVVTAGRAWVEGVEVANLSEVSVSAQPFTSFDPLAVAGNGPWVAYLEVWERFVGSEDDPRLLEPALGGPDTATRVQKAWRVALAPVTAAEAQALRDGDRPDLSLWRPSDAALAARTTPGGAAPADRPCLLPSEGGYLGPENRLHRVEVHRGGDRGQVRFKVSTQNGSVRAVVAEQAGVRTLEPVQEGSDFRTGDWVELRSPVNARADRAGTLHRLTVNPDRSVTFQPSSAQNVDGYVAIRWDHQGGDGDGLPIGNGWVDLTDGIQVQVAGTRFRSGDHWTIPARATTGTIEWPPVIDLTSAPAVAVAPQGPWRGFCPLQLLGPAAGGGPPTITDGLITEFPPLTALEARDVAYDGSRVDIDGAETVQEALENLAGRGHGSGSCTYTAVPGADLQGLVDAIPKGSSGRICLAVGDYHLPAPLRVDGLGDIELVGAGTGTHLVAVGHETTVGFADCRSVRVAHLHLTSSAQRAANPGRNGALDLERCGRTTIDEVDVTRSGGHGSRHCAAIAVRHGTAAAPGRGPHDVSITGCRLAVGVQQIGVQVVDGRRVRIADCVIRPTDDRSTYVWDRLVADRWTRGAIADLLLSNRRIAGTVRHGIGADLVGNGWIERTYRLDRRTIEVIVRPDLAERLDGYLAAGGPPGIDDDASLGGHLRNTIMRALGNGGRVSMRSRRGGLQQFDLMTGIVRSFRTTIRSFMAEGIVVAGRGAIDVEITGNEVGAAVAPIRVALSHEGQTAADRDIVERCSVDGNRVEVAAVPFARRPTGIEVVHPDSALVHGNLVVQRADVAIPVKGGAVGIDMLGRLGPFVEVSSNDLRLGGALTTGVRVRPDRGAVARFKSPLWLVSRNHVRSAAMALDLHAKVDRERNVAT